MQKLLLAVIALGIPLSAIGAVYPHNTWLQVGPVAAGLPLAWWALRRWPLSDASAAMLALFVLLHLFAARWSYRFVPYRDWLMMGGMPDMVGTNGDARNMFDRLVHFMFGLLLVLPLAETGVRHWAMRRGHAIFTAVLVILALGGLYEIFEWSLTLSMAPEQAGAYNGEQGDIYDAQKDMAIAALGALIAVLPAIRRLRQPAGGMFA